MKVKVKVVSVDSVVNKEAYKKKIQSVFWQQFKEGKINFLELSELITLNGGLLF